MDTNILPLAITMMAGPQIVSAIVLVTGRRPVSASLAFVAAVATAASLGIWLFLQLAAAINLPQSSSGSQDRTVEFVLVGLLIAGAFKTYVNREDAEPPKWMGSLQSASVGKAFLTGLLLIGLMPSDLMVMLTSSVHLHQSGGAWRDAVPFIALTTLIAAVPLVLYLLFRRRAAVAMPKVRRWLDANSWAVNIGVYLLFIYLILN